jgi:molecular chaperone GrpE
VEDFIAQCIPVLDSFDMAFRDKNTWNEAPENWRRGVEYIYTQFLSVLRANGVEKVTPLNERFDPLVHDSVGTAPIDTLEREGIILDVIQNGYTLSGKLIRAPKVIVGHYVLPHH